MAIFAQRLRELREAHNLTRAEVARALHVSTQTYNRYENDLNKRGLSFLVKVAVFYNVSTDFLLGQTPKT